MSSRTVAVVGGSGLIGTAVLRGLSAAGCATTVVPAPRLQVPAGQDGMAAARALAPAVELISALRGCDSVVLAAGSAWPGSPPTPALFGANAALPLVLLKAAEAAGARHLVHISSAAVQGRREPLDESPTTEPFSGYSLAKALGERLLLDHQSAVEVCIYRPTSVLAPERGLTRALVRLARLPVTPLPGAGNRPLPVAHIDNVAAAVAHLVDRQLTGIVLHPWEGFDLRTLLTVFGARRFVLLPLALAGPTRFAARSRSAKLAAAARRVDLLVQGQSQQARVLLDAGFVPPRSGQDYKLLTG